MMFENYIINDIFMEILLTLINTTFIQKYLTNPTDGRPQFDIRI